MKSIKGKEAQPEIKQGEYFDAQENSLGICKEWVEFESENPEESGQRTIYSEYYDKQENLIGKCWNYIGPGSSGGAGTNCDSEELMEESFEGQCAEEEKPHWCRPWPKYNCIID